MSDDDFSADLRQFVAQHIESLAQLEALLLLRSEPQRNWTCAELTTRLYISNDMCGGLLADLEKRQFAARSAHLDAGEAALCYAATGETDRLLGELGRLYHERRVAVITEIYSKPVNKVQTLADAFRLRWEQ